MSDAAIQFMEMAERAFAQRDALASAIRDYLATFDRCGGSESVSAEEFAERRQHMRDLVGPPLDSGK